jgi:hypothetical protein
MAILRFTNVANDDVPAADALRALVQQIPRPDCAITLTVGTTAVPGRSALPDHLGLDGARRQVARERARRAVSS